MYARLPILTPAERLERLDSLDLSTVQLTLAEALPVSGMPIEQIRVGMLSGRPVYRFLVRGSWITVFADTGEELSNLTQTEALAVGARFAPEHEATIRYGAYLTDADQWTFGVRTLMPVHRLHLGDSASTILYVSDQIGEPVLVSTRSGRRWGYAGAVMHWLYFTPVRRHTDLWIQSVIWLSIAGSLLCLSGLVWGVYRFSSHSRYRIKHTVSRSPYAGLMRWHHYVGLAFGLVTFTWVLSGCLSLDPWNWHPDTVPTLEQRNGVTGGPLRIETVTVGNLQTAQATLASEFSVKELEILQFQSEVFVAAYRPPIPRKRNQWTFESPMAFLSSVLPFEHRMISLKEQPSVTFTRFDNHEVLSAAVAAMPEFSIEEASWLQDYDAYYYNRAKNRPLPVLRVQYDDPQKTWLYIDPRRGQIVLKEERLTRLNRWLYHGFHSLDFPFLYRRRPLWDIVVISLSIGGLGLSTLTLIPVWRRLRRHGRRLSRRELPHG